MFYACDTKHDRHFHRRQRSKTLCHSYKTKKKSASSASKVAALIKTIV